MGASSTIVSRHQHLTLQQSTAYLAPRPLSLRPFLHLAIHAMVQGMTCLVTCHDTVTRVNQSNWHHYHKECLWTWRPPLCLPTKIMLFFFYELEASFSFEIYILFTFIPNWKSLYNLNLSLAMRYIVL